MREADRNAATGPAATIVVAALGLVLLGGGFVLGLYALTPQPDRTQLLNDLRPLLAAAIAAVPAIIAALFVRQLQSETKQQSGQLRTIERQTNGELRTAVRDIVQDVIDERLPVQRIPTAVEIVTPRFVQTPTEETSP